MCDVNNNEVALTCYRKGMTMSLILASRSQAPAWERISSKLRFARVPVRSLSLTGWVTQEQEELPQLWWRGSITPCCNAPLDDASSGGYNLPHESVASPPISVPNGPATSPVRVAGGVVSRRKRRGDLGWVGLGGSDGGVVEYA